MPSPPAYITSSKRAIPSSSCTPRTRLRTFSSVTSPKTRTRYSRST
ncbi:Uncharacterised protein [Vibrio cholerae]|nr:Uncharacterised protein [Vibrio cholerae]